MKKKVYISIGDFYASRESAIIYTLLGSCVAVCLYDWKNRIGGMNHILLPGRPNLNNFDSSARYGINAMELLINRIMNLGGDRKALVAKVFGGGHVISAISRANSVGTRIGEFVKDFLKNERIEIVSQDLGGEKIRKVFFHTDSGDVFVKGIATSNNILYVKEKQKRKHLNDVLKEPGKIEIFS
jgi:chemotaxis protein CheD